jgi:hypothetical protein
MKTIKISNLQEGDVFMYKGVMYEIVHKDKWETYCKYVNDKYSLLKRNWEMETKQVLSIEQMKHLQELGLDTSDASVYWKRVSHGSRINDKYKGVWFLSLQKEFQTCGFTSYEILSAYTLGDILDKLPESVQVYDLYIFKKVGLWWLKYVDVTNNGTVRLEKMPKLIDAAYYMLCWCIQKGFVKTNKEVKDGRKEN